MMRCLLFVLSVVYASGCVWDLTFDANAPDGSTPMPIRCSPEDDPDGDTIGGAEEGEGDLDGDGVPNFLDTDADGDGIDDQIEAGDTECFTPAVDSDGDSIPDFLDLDSDADTISDAIEGSRDPDGDEVPNYLDHDSDADGVSDSEEAGDLLLSTAPTECMAEVDPVTGRRQMDGIPDFLDPDSDNDGLSDADELDLGTNPCSLDSDGDGAGDLEEGAYERINCTDDSTEACGCASNPECGIPPEHISVVLPFGGAPVDRDLEFDATATGIDVVLLSEDTFQARSDAPQLAAWLNEPNDGAFRRISDALPTSEFAVAAFSDFPFTPHGSSAEEPMRIGLRLEPAPAPGFPWPTMNEAFGTFGSGIPGGDRGTSGTEALFQMFTGAGGRYGSGAAIFEWPEYAAACASGRTGAPCFRAGVRPVVLHHMRSCAHDAPEPNPDAGCGPYIGITPRTRRWDEMVTRLSRSGARYIGLHSGSTACSASSAEAVCNYLEQTARVTGSVDTAGRGVVLEVPEVGSGGSMQAEVLADTVVRLGASQPLDVDTLIRDDDGESEAVDARRFILSRQPACEAAPPLSPCWTAPAGFEGERPVGGTDSSTFFSVIPGSQLIFRIRFENRFLEGGASVRAFAAFIDIRGDGVLTLQTRQVYVVVPASSSRIVI